MKNINLKLKPVLEKTNLNFQVNKQCLHEIKKNTCFGSILMLKYLNKVYFSFYTTLENSSPNLNDY